MARVALSFLGVSRRPEGYEKLKYIWKEKEMEREYETDLFAEAVNAWFSPDKLFVFVTRKVKEQDNLKKLQTLCGEKLVPVDIPNGQSEDELWKIFDILVNTVEEGDSVILDITLGFRTLPLLGFAVTVFLKRLRNVKVEKILYGACDSKDPETMRTPVFDMTPLVELMDWLEGLDALTRRADASELAGLLKQAQSLINKDGGFREAQFDKVSNNLAHLSDSLHLSRPLKVMEYANKVSSLLAEVIDRDESNTKVRPFILLINQIKQEVSALAHGYSQELSSENLHCQLELVNYYLNKGLLVQAITLMREWLVNLLGLKINKDSWLTNEGREHIECVMKHSNSNKYVPGIKKVWIDATSLRNDIAHSGMNGSPARPSRIRKQAQRLYKQLVELLNGSTPDLTSTNSITIDVSRLYQGQAKIDELDTYICGAQKIAGEGNDVVLTGSGPIWLYLKIAHALHGRVRKLGYTSPVSGEVMVFDHDPF